ncbi:MAG: hypothetical protein J6B93_02125 [Clostridia bacterium]|nr:hypothetical protein [Clostridia bacterium]
MCKRLLVVLLSLVLVFSFVACGKDKIQDTDISGSGDASSSEVDNTQDFMTEFDNSDLTSSELEELEDLWDQVGDGSIEVSSSEPASSTEDSSESSSSPSTPSSSTEASSSEESSSAEASSEEGNGIGGDRDGWLDTWV